MLPSADLDWPICWEGVALIANSEGNKYTDDGRIKSYRCPAGVWTGPWGVTLGVRQGMTWTHEEGSKLFCEYLCQFTDSVRKLLKEDADDEELAAMVSLAWNIGVGAFSKSTVLKQHNAGNREAAARAFGLWNKSKGQVLRGLVARRAKEAALYLTPDIGDMPQQVDGESALAASPMAQSGAGVAGAGGLAAATEYSEQFKNFFVSIGLQPMHVLIGVAVLVGAVIIYQRHKQRQGGWA